VSRKLEITINEHTIQATLRDTATADAIYALLPFESKAQTWGNEVYFSTPVSNQILENDAKNVVQLGELSFWVEGNCISFASTPIS